MRVYVVLTMLRCSRQGRVFLRGRKENVVRDGPDCVQHLAVPPPGAVPGARGRDQQGEVGLTNIT